MADIAIIPDQDITIIDRAIDTFREASAVLRKNRDRANKALEIGQAIIADWIANNRQMTPELDQRFQKHLVNCAKAKTEMMEERKIFTQTVTMMVKAYTGEESKIDVTDKETPAYQIQQIRNAYAKQLHEEEQARQKQIELQRQKDQEAINIKAEAEKRLIAYVATYTKEETTRINTAFNQLSLETFEDRSNKLKAMLPVYPYAHFQQFQHGITSRLFSKDEIDSLLKVHIESKFQDLANGYKDQICELQAYLIDRLPSKKSELISIKEMEEERQRELQEQERIRQEQATANAARQQELEKERLASQERQRLADIERKRIADEQRVREEKEREEREEQERIRMEQQQAQVDSNKEVEQTMSLFDTEVAVADNTTDKPEARKGYEITVTGAAGWMQIFQTWFTETGRNLDNDKIAGTKMETMKTFCEKLAHRDLSKKIASNFITYNESFKAVNRKAN